MTTRKHILVDIDHTLASSFWRDDMIGGEGGWDAYHAASSEDEPIHDVVTIVNAFYGVGMTVIGVTARPEKWRQVTMGWLVKHFISMDELLMRPDDAYHPAPEIKVALALERFDNKANLKDQVALVIDDRDDVIEAFRALGVTAIQVFGRKS